MQKNETWLIIVVIVGSALISFIGGISLGIRFVGRNSAIDKGYFKHGSVIYKVEKFSELKYPKLEVENNE